MSERIEAQLHDAFELVPGAASASVITCEHASERMPEGFAWAAQDAWLRGTHWTHDPGAEALSRELSAALDAPAVLARFTRLLSDPNRPLDSDTLFRARAEGRAIALNASIDAAERERRLARTYQPFHDAVDAAVARSRGPLVIAIHTFTPVYEGQRRELELGVLFDREDALGARWVEALARQGHRVAPNEPYSGKEGLVYVAHRHAVAHGRRAIELEVRNDLALDAEFRARLLPTLVALAAR